MTLSLKEYRDPADGRTYQYDEGKQPAGFKPADEAPAKSTPKPANKAAVKPADKA